MKTSICSMVLFFLFTISIFSQKDWKFSSISVSTGETSLTKGLTFSGSISSGNKTIAADFNAELGQALLFYNFSNHFSAGPTVGFYKNVLWFAPIASTSLFNSHIKTLHWGGWSFGNSETSKNETKAIFMFSYQQISICTKSLEVSYALQHYYRFSPEHIFSLKRTINFNENLSAFVSGGYMKTAQKYLWAMGASYNFN